ncbi:methyl-accepting chemotaxis protein [Deefgea salmonis]|uniref:Methyl-accepting chemotaxis protein n=1 Tax=Deefgea salmonis TaxID=2875502 RepID=A0ABS8BLN2_9NEIS|nr:methyl-accepting chemotaxis protein [Deefgea salmonis]MCB5196632.1 methyl-accepting chemotaxis protein [Deefgea salmonis]
MHVALRIKHKLWMLTGLALIGLLGIGIAMLLSSRQSMLEDREAKTLSLIELGHSVIAHYGQLEKNGILSKEAAQAQAKAALKNLRYDQDNYFSIYDPQYRMVQHPIKPELTGKDLSGLKDKNGVPIVVELVKAAQSGQVEFVRYLWPKPGQDNPVAKISTAKLFQPWGWVIASGIYIDDLDAIFQRRALLLGGALAVVASVLLLASLWIAHSITSPLDTLRVAMQQIAVSGDLTRRVKISGNRDLAEIADTFNALIASLQQLLMRVSSATQQVSQTTDQLVNSSQAVEQSSVAQHRAAASVTVAIEQISTSIDQVAANVCGTADVTRELRELAGHGRQAVKAAADEMHQIANDIDASADAVHSMGQRSLQISEIVGVIREIADQTNLLALNAAIEAARAGETGRGFAVVADEVRKLAERTGQSTQQITETIQKIQQETQSVVGNIVGVSQRARQGAQLAQQADLLVEQLDQHSAQVEPLVSEISSATQEQSRATQHIARNVEDISSMAENNVREVGGAANSVRQLKTLVLELNGRVEQFKV